ncbi:M15 family metallopeptidase [Pseudomonas sp. TTU2014-080ASC]|uniref:M15 family metallopeptidase n=1 Tax=Pseudomonas sp. TTU2014-080ASC TaxID=1729724 RepID=UPI0007183226|nr:M15 family metallopeptidase [Pseudomonas sp. TTU2014-080ASC]KRW61491.1 hypothetical protein AO726_09220 [Pseudomonas sp. TTU2014-080ASC]
MNSARLHHFAQEFGVPDDFFLCRQVLEYEEAEQLVTAATNADGREHRLSPEAAKAWKEMHAAALNSGISLFIVSAFRSVQRQAELIRRKLAAGQSITEVLSVSALPGCSEHHTGNAVDVGTAGYALLETEFEQSPAFAWLTDNAASFGFYLSFPRGNPYGYNFEPWHWCYRKG